MKKLVVALVVPFASSLIGCALEPAPSEQAIAPEQQEQAEQQEQELSASARGAAQVVDARLPSSVRPVKGVRRGDVVLSPVERVSHRTTIDDARIPSRMYRRQGAVIAPAEGPDAPVEFDTKPRGE